MFIEKLKDEYLRTKFEFKRDSFKKFMAGKDVSDNLFGQLIDELGPKVVAHTLALKEPRIISVDETIEVGSVALPMEVLEHFIKKSTHRFIVNFCFCRDVMDCKDYPIDMGCLFLGEGTMQIDPEIGRLASVEEALEHAKKWRDLGLICSLGYVPFDAVLLEVDPPEQLMSVCGCCPCCCVTTKIPPDRMEGVEVLVSEDDCTACESCLEECVYNGMQIIDDKAVTNDRCVACGRCVNTCPEDAIEIRISDSAYVDKTIKRFKNILDVTS